jgi:hypothetical protein
MDFVVAIALILVISGYLFYNWRQRLHLPNNSYFWILLGLHAVLTITYMLYAANSSSDSVAYYHDSSAEDDWGDLFGSSTTFIRFLTWPFSNLLGFSYYATMMVFSYIGFLAIFFLYLAAKENLSLHPILGKLTWVEIVFLLPNLHFWSSSIGKGSVILLGMALFVFGLSRFNKRGLILITGLTIVFFVRPHIFLAIVVGVMLGILLTNFGIKSYIRWGIFIAALAVFFLTSSSVLNFVGTDSYNVLDNSMLAQRAAELSKAKSGVNLAEYNIFLKLFTFWFRPLFIDAPGVIGLIVSFENLFYLFVFFLVIREAIVEWGNFNGWYRIMLFIFILGSIMLSQVTANLGIAMRQKAQLMPLLFIVFCKAMSLIQRKDEGSLPAKPQFS